MSTGKQQKVACPWFFFIVKRIIYIGRSDFMERSILNGLLKWEQFRNTFVATKAKMILGREAEFKQRY